MPKRLARLPVKRKRLKYHPPIYCERDICLGDFKCLQEGKIVFCLFVTSKSLLATRFSSFDFYQFMTILTKTGDIIVHFIHKKGVMGCKSQGCL